MKYTNKKIAILGFGIEGKDAYKYLVDKGNRLVVYDKNKDLDVSGYVGGNFIVGEDYLEKGLKDFDIIVRSPGIYRHIKEIDEAEKSGVEITSPLQIFLEENVSKVIGVTGTKGKGTTSTLIYSILKNAGKDVYLAGNIGKPYLELLTKLNQDSVVVMEISSFQLMSLSVSPDVAVVLNITSDHMDWHKNQMEYLDAKANIVAYQKTDDFALLNNEYETSSAFAKKTVARVVNFSKKELPAKYKSHLILRGEHNLENIAAAVKTAEILGINEETIINTIQSFKGLEHRLEMVGEVDGVTYYNDSFATGPQPTIAAINAFSESETLILGGSDKFLDFTEMAKVISQKNNVKNILLIGETARKIKESIKKFPYTGVLYDLGSPSMKAIVEKAKSVTKSGGVVILSPACASFDMFENYKDRGNQFKKEVSHLNNG